MTKIVYNATYGGFNLSYDAVMLYCQLKGIAVYPETTEWSSVIYWLTPSEPEVDAEELTLRPELEIETIDRTDPALVEVVERLGAAANIHGGNLKIRDLPKGTRYRIQEYDGFESVLAESEYHWKVA